MKPRLPGASIAIFALASLLGCGDDSSALMTGTNASAIGTWQQNLGSMDSGIVWVIEKDKITYTCTIAIGEDSMTARAVSKVQITEKKILILEASSESVSLGGKHCSASFNPTELSYVVHGNSLSLSTATVDEPLMFIRAER